MTAEEWKPGPAEERKREGERGMENPNEQILLQKEKERRRQLTV